jgi:hypothetical protein
MHGFICIFHINIVDFIEKRIAGNGRLFNLCTDSYVFSIVDFIEKRIAGKGRLFNFFKFGGASG